VVSLAAAALFGLLLVSNARLDAAQTKLTAETERADRLGKALQSAIDDREKLDAVLSAKDAAMARFETDAARTRAVIDRSRNTVNDREVSPLVRDYLETLRGKP
jgi:hypothetical protein